MANDDDDDDDAERIKYKLLSLTNKVLTTSQPDYLHTAYTVYR